MERRGEWTDAGRGLWAKGCEPLTALDLSIGRALQRNGVVGGRPAGVFHGFDGVTLDVPEIVVTAKQSGRGNRTRRRHLGDDRIVAVGGVCITNPLQTLLDLAAELDEDTWEQALESALRKRQVTIAEIDAALVPGGRGVRTIRGVLARRPVGAPATESLLETLMVQLIRPAELPPPTRQVRVCGEGGELIARVDLAWPELGVFIELDGEHHKDQPVHDANRQTRVAAETGWLCGRFAWTEVVRTPETSARRVRKLIEQAQRRPLSA
jgi:hypothetical protein